MATPFKLKGHTLPGIKQKPVTEKPKTDGKEINIKTNNSKLYGVDWKGYEPPVTEGDKNLPNKKGQDNPKYRGNHDEVD